MAKKADDRIAIRASREEKEILQEKAKKDRRSLSSWGLKVMLAHGEPSGTGSGSSKWARIYRLG